MPKYYKNYIQNNILLSLCDLFQHISSNCVIKNAGAMHCKQILIKDKYC